MKGIALVGVAAMCVGAGAAGLADVRAEAGSVATEAAAMSAVLRDYIDARIGEFDRIPAERRAVLEEMAAFVRERAEAGEACDLTFICTHNSRRSHFGQVWAAVAAAHFGAPRVTTYSGGTEATAFHPRAVNALERAGMEIERTTEGANPIYHVRFAEGAAPVTCFSKVYDQAPNPREGFAAVMTCGDADEKCPVVRGAAARIPVRYEDPKAFDGQKVESAKYDERCAQIAREMLYAFSVAARRGS